MNRPERFFLRMLQFFSLLLILAVALAGGMLISCQSAQAAENGSRIPGVLEYARKYGEEKQKAAATQSGGKKAEQRPQAVRKESANKVPSETRLRQRLRQQEVMLEQIRRENRQLRQQWAKKAGAVSGENGMLQKQIVTLSAELKQLQVVQKSAQEEQARLKSLLAEMPIATADELKKPVARQDYAAGVMTGRDLLVMQEGQGLLGLKTDNRLLLAGLRDALNQQVKLNSTALQEALSAAEVRTRQARERIVIAQKAVGEKYLAAFRKGKGTEKDDSGFWYRLEYAGDGEPIRGEDTRVEVVVNEKLTDGSVVEDMDASGRSLVMKLGDYPPLFRRALERMKNHATMTLVVPPELAYGDEGYPPKVPPGATMVYTLRVESVTAAEKGVPGKDGENSAAGEKNESRKPKL
ncbi:peptidylprolyl isomerase [Salmonella enterica subsp. salamae]|uniref:peptidylprolyl isomerase n=9 Tax=Salmonella enterica TaxID=28901 RepID=A0A6C7CTU8_SALER|nr:peptidylprolyl isomerase [Salmonella enterica subsp. salamae serovar 56:b:[1,5]]EAA6224617.1 peptidylprolyl isomerase [Salmonella enterica subsp. salamae]EAA8874323.1 peptidylprolyl isomerase [Salmonella enterica]EBI0477634.1 peptidylprolyl isomerase [Salmonella enterica subsp. enterica serovar Braenderup]EBP3807021.1 peptidylprolyl isomerase [Salmonella enterica subsp. enterica]ECT8651917.1 peptidylprolyl isomerase [Salmonella enterica subsp. salamae serovar 50:b:z6]EDT5056968.1 peptidylp